MLRTTLTLALTLIALSSNVTAADQSVKHVVLISVDGLSASYLSDPRADMKHLRKIAATGATAKGMQTIFPSVTWPAHTSIITGVTPARHGVIGNAVWNRRANNQLGKQLGYIGDPTLTKDEAIHVPTLYDAAHDAGLSTASVIWPCSNGAKTLDWIIPDSNKPRLHARYTTPSFADDLAAAGIDISRLGEWGWKKELSTQRDTVYTQVALHLLREHQVNLILLHLVTPDGVEHLYGPNTPPAYEAVAESDRHIGEIWDALQQPPFAGQSTLVVVSDHGFAPYQKIIQPNAMLRQLGLIELDAEDRVTRRDAWCVAQGGSAFLYVLDDDRRAEILEQLVESFEEMKQFVEVLRPDRFTELGTALPEGNPEAPDLILTTVPGFAFKNELDGATIIDAGGTKGTHGHDPRPDYMHATFVAAGAGIQSGVELGLINVVDVAPTIAHLLKLEMDTDGRVLQEALTH